MARIDSYENFLTDMANCIREISGTEDAIMPANMDTAVSTKVAELNARVDELESNPDILFPLTEAISNENIKTIYYVKEIDKVGYEGSAVWFTTEEQKVKYTGLEEAGIGFNLDLLTQLDSILPDWRDLIIFGYSFNFHIDADQYAAVYINSDLRCWNIWDLGLDEDTVIAFEMAVMEGIIDKPGCVFGQFIWYATMGDKEFDLFKCTRMGESKLHKLELSDFFISLVNGEIDSSLSGIDTSVMDVYYKGE